MNDGSASGSCRLAAGFGQETRSIRVAAVYAILALLFSIKIEINSSKTKRDSGSNTPEEDAVKKDSSKTTKKQPKETVMQNLNTLTMRVKVGGAKVVLALAGVWRQS